MSLWAALACNLACNSVAPEQFTERRAPTQQHSDKPAEQVDTAAEQVATHDPAHDAAETLGSEQSQPLESANPGPHGARAGVQALLPDTPLPASIPRAEFVPALSPQKRAQLERSLASRLSRSIEGLPHYHVNDQAQAVDLRGHFQHVVVQVRDERGQFRTECLESQKQLAEFLQAGAQ